MKEYKISANDSGRRLDKFIFHVLINAPHSFAYKMLRKKNIVLNDSKATGNELLCEGDIVKFYLSDETFDKFSVSDTVISDESYQTPDVVYEDEDIILVNKPSGMLTQRSVENDISLNDICRSYLKKTFKAYDETLKTFTPSICNRLDRNTSGFVIFAKSYKGARAVSEAIREHKLRKYYECIVLGTLNEDLELCGTLVKDETTNTVRISDSDPKDANIKTIVHPVRSYDGLSLIEIELITGKTHQIRAHMASIGHPILGDPKYGNRSVNRSYKERFGTDSQMLVCYKLKFPEDFPLKNVSGKTFEIRPPEDFYKVMR